MWVSANWLKHIFKALILSDYTHQNFNTFLVKIRAKVSSKHLKNRLLIQLTLVLNFFKNNYIIKAKDNDFAMKFSFRKKKKASAAISPMLLLEMEKKKCLKSYQLWSILMEEDGAFPQSKLANLKIKQMFAFSIGFSLSVSMLY